MILCVAGQSNAVGYDESPVAANALTRVDRTRIAQLGLYGEDNLRVVPLGVCAQNLQDMRPYGHPSNPGVGTKGIHLPLARLLLKEIPEDYGILVIPCAYGGTGFTARVRAQHFGNDAFGRVVAPRVAQTMAKRLGSKQDGCR